MPQLAVPDDAPGLRAVRQVTPHAAVLLQDNPGPMTLDGTNTWLLRAPGSAGGRGRPGPGTTTQHLERGARAAGAGIDADRADPPAPRPRRARAGAARARPARRCARSTRRCASAATPLADGEVLAGGRAATCEVLATPGTRPTRRRLRARRRAPVLTGDTILGRGTTVVAHPDGVLGAYLDSLRRLRDLGDVAVLPGHGPELPHAGAVAAQYLAHRARAARPGPRRARRARRRTRPRAQIVEHVYADVDRVRVVGGRAASRRSWTTCDE